MHEYPLQPALASDSPVDRAAGLARAIPPNCAIAANGIVPTWVQNGVAHAEMLVAEHHLNQVGVVQGGVYALFADAVAGFAAMSAVKDGKTFVTLDMRVNLLRAVSSGTRLLAEAEPIHLGRSTLVFGVTLYPEGAVEKPTAFFVCTQLVVDAA
jgi:1,4-dihydroxy-2-naphthoyl-CoA hydrolase